MSHLAHGCSQAVQRPGQGLNRVLSRTILSETLQLLAKDHRHDGTRSCLTIIVNVLHVRQGGKNTSSVLLNGGGATECSDTHHCNLSVPLFIRHLLWRRGGPTWQACVISGTASCSTRALLFADCRIVGLASAPIPPRPDAPSQRAQVPRSVSMKTAKSVQKAKSSAKQVVHCT